MKEEHDMSNTANITPPDSGKENLKSAILVQARLIAELRKEVDKLKANKDNSPNRAKRVSAVR